MRISFWRWPLVGRVAAPALVSRGMTLVTGSLLLPPTSAQARPLQPSAPSQQSSVTVQTATLSSRFDMFARGVEGALWHR